MTSIRFLTTSLCAAVLGLASFASHAAVAVAVGDGNYTYTVTGYADLDEAKDRALKQCALEANNCRLTLWSPNAGAVALAKGKGGMFSIMEKTPEAARDKALAGCRKSYKSCEFSALYWEPGGAWAAWAYAKDAKGLAVANYFASEYGSEAGAKKAAIEGCERQQEGTQKHPCMIAAARRGGWALARVVSSNDSSINSASGKQEAIAAAMASCRKDAAEPATCKPADVLVNPGEQAQPKSFDKVYAASVLARERRAEARQVRNVRTSAVRQLSCQNSCVNGNCVRTFADGRKERWQAPRVFDPLTNDWKWDTNSCGG